MAPSFATVPIKGGEESDPLVGEDNAAAVDSSEAKSQRGKSYNFLQTPLLMALNFFSAVGIVVANKALFRGAGGLGFATSLTGVHFIATAIGVLPITIAFCAFVAFNNLSLQYNGVSFYQLMKILTTPAVVVLQLVFFKVALPFKLLVTLVPICGGVALSTANDTDVSMDGALWALAGLLAAAGYQVLVKSTQQNLKVSSLQLLHHQAPQAAFLILLVSPFFDETGELLAIIVRAFSRARPSHWQPTAQVEGAGVEAAAAAAVTEEADAAGEGEEGSATLFWAGMVLLSCLLAFLVNLSTFLVIGKTSPVSYQVLGHFKLVVILLVGVAGFGEQSSPARLSGMALALAGIVGYTTLKQGLGSGWESRGKGGSGSGSGGGGEGGGGVELMPSGQEQSGDVKGGEVGPSHESAATSFKGRL
eukprot:g9956.t1